MEDARRRLDDGSFESVSARHHLSGSFLDAVRQASQNHELFCPHCSAGVNFVKSSTRAIAGTNEQTVSPHFRLAAGESHEKSCPIKRFEGQHSQSREYDTELGWRIHLNTREFSSEYATRDAVYFRDSNHHLQVNPRRLPAGESAEKFMSRAPIAAKNVKDLLDIVGKGDVDRLNDSYVIYEDKVIPWSSFFIRQRRYFDLAKRLEAGASHLPVLLHMEVERGVTRGYKHPANYAAGKPHFWKRNAHGNEVFLQSRAWLDNRDDGFLRDAFREAGEYFVLGLARLTHPSGSLKAVNVSLTSFEQVEKGSLDDLVEKACGSNASPQKPANE